MNWLKRVVEQTLSSKSNKSAWFTASGILILCLLLVCIMKGLLPAYSFTQKSWADSQKKVDNLKIKSPPNTSTTTQVQSLTSSSIVTLTAPSVSSVTVSQAPQNGSNPQTTPLSEVKSISWARSDISSLLQKNEGFYSVAFQDLRSESQWSIHPARMQSASTIKLFIMIEAYARIQAGTLNEDDTITLNSVMKTDGSGTLSALPDGSEITYGELIFRMITESDNTAANILIDCLSMKAINSRIQKLGLNDTVLMRKMMDLDSIEMGKDNFTSTADLCITLDKIFNNQCLGQKYDMKMLEILKKQTINTKIPKYLPDGISVAHKTGELPGIENDAGIIIYPKGSFILCVLSKNVPDSAKAQSLIGNIAKTIFNAMN